MAEAVVDRREENRSLGKHWISHFLSRHPGLASKLSSQLNRQRAFASNPAALKDYFTKVRALLDTPGNYLYSLVVQLQGLIKFYNISNSKIYNMDERGSMMGVTLRCKVICRKGPWVARLTQDGSREWITVIEALSGDGCVLRPMIINKGQAQYIGWYAKLKKKDLANFGVSEKGWSTEVLCL